MTDTNPDTITDQLFAEAEASAPIMTLAELTSPDKDPALTSYGDHVLIKDEVEITVSKGSVVRYTVTKVLHKSALANETLEVGPVLRSRRLSTEPLTIAEAELLQRHLS